MSRLAHRLRETAALAERAAIARQYQELTGPRANLGVIGGLQLAADTLHDAAGRLGPPPAASSRFLIASAWQTGGWIVFCVAVLLVVPDPARPWVLAATIAGGGVVSSLLGSLVGAILDRRSIRALASEAEATAVGDVIVTLRDRIAAITASLEPDRDDTHLAVGGLIEHTLIWLDAAEEAARA